MSHPWDRSLARRLGTGDAVVIGLGAMIGAGVFAAVGPAAQAAGSWLLLGLALAAVVAYANATSSAQLAAKHPTSGGTYVFASRELGPMAGYLAGWGFVVGKTASLAAMALTFGAYLWPGAARPAAVAAVVALTAVTSRGITRTARLTRVIVTVVLASLAVVVAASLLGGQAELANLAAPATATATPYGVLQSAGLLFFAFAGYARLATLGEEVVDPARTIPRAIPLALGLTLVVYALVAVSALLAVGPGELARAPAPLAAAVRAGGLAVAAPAVQVGATVASLGVLLSLLVGVSRTVLAMARDGHLPRPLARINDRSVPAVAEVTVAAVVIAIVAVADLREAIGFSSFAVLVDYALTNASALRLTRAERRWPRGLAWVGLVGCVVLAATLPPVAVVSGAGVLALGLAAHGVRRWLARR